MGRSPFAESVTQQVQKSAARFPWQNESRVSTIRAMGMDLECWRYSRTYGGSDCGWVDKVEWSGSAPEVTPPPPSTWTEVGYTYDPAGRRIEKKYDGTTVVKYLYDGDHCIAEYDGNNNLLRKYIYGPAVDEPISMIDVEHSNATYYYHFDGLGSVAALTNASGTTAVLYEYSVYGQVAASDPNHPNRFMFTGREFDKETGLYYYRARYYNPEIGRFLQTDPTGYGDGMNWYAYCKNNSIVSVDSSGCDDYGFHRSGDKLEFYCHDAQGNQTGAWQFDSMDAWLGWAENDQAGIFGTDWMKTEVGWTLAGQGVDHTQKWWFWRIKAIIWLHAGGMETMIRKIEEQINSGTMRIRPLLDDSYRNFYTSANNKVEWSPRQRSLPSKTYRNWHTWYSPLVSLSHELVHLADDVAYDRYDDQVVDSELRAVRYEDRVRWALFNFDPTCSNLWPRPGVKETAHDIKGATTAAEAWAGFNEKRVGYYEYYYGPLNQGQ